MGDRASLGPRPSWLAKGPNHVHEGPPFRRAERLGVARHVEAALTDDAVDQAVGVTLNGRFRQVGDPRKVLADRAPAATVGAMADGAVRVEERASLLQNFR